LIIGHNVFARRDPTVKKPTEMTRRKPTRGRAGTQSAKLEKGQIWKAGENYVLIGEAGKRLISYRITKKLEQRGLRKHLAQIVTVQAFLKANLAELLVKS
jgi:hypothetical protein